MQESTRHGRRNVMRTSMRAKHAPLEAHKERLHGSGLMQTGAMHAVWTLERNPALGVDGSGV